MGFSAQAPAGEAASWSGLLARVSWGARDHLGAPTQDQDQHWTSRWTISAALRARVAGAGQRAHKPCHEGATSMDQIGDTVYVPVKALAPGGVMRPRPLPWVMLN